MASERAVAASRAETYGASAARCIRKGLHADASVDARIAASNARVALGELWTCACGYQATVICTHCGRPKPEENTDG